MNILPKTETKKNNLERLDEFTFADRDLMLRVLGPRGENLSSIARELSIEVGQRGETLIFRGDAERVHAGKRLVEQLSRTCRGNRTLKESDVVRGSRILADNPEAELHSIFNEVVHVTANRRLITPKGLAQKRYVDAMRKHDLTFGIGPAGTGKTYLAVAVAISELLAGRYKRIVLTRPAVEAGEKLGFLPGDMVEKINPYVRPLYDALNDMLDFDRTQALIAQGQIEIAPLAFMRGRTLNDAFVILDEAQNTTRSQMKMFLTRLGYSSRAVVTGDVTQIDLPGRTLSGLIDAEQTLGHLSEISFCRFSGVDVVRHALVQQIIEAYDERDNRRSRPQVDGEDDDVHESQ